MRKPLERDVAKVVTDYLGLNGWLLIRTEANAVTRGKGHGGIVAKGEPDARAFKGDKALHIEFKREGKKATTAQQLRHKYLAEFGIKVHIISSIADAQKMLEES